METVKKLWDATKMMFLIIEPGTPVGFSNLAEIRQVMLKWGAHIAAPCPHESDCPKEKK
jgi:ribosomal protein RSM22 (predicted rRNA methylase)